MSFFLFACSNDTDIQESQTNDFALKSELNFTDIKNISVKIDSCMMQTRGTGQSLLTDTEAKKLLTPMIDDGEKIRLSILSNHTFDKI